MYQTFWTVDRILIGFTNPDQGGLGSNNPDEILHKLKDSSPTMRHSSVSYPEHLIGLLVNSTTVAEGNHFHKIKGKVIGSSDQKFSSFWKNLSPYSLSHTHMLMHTRVHSTHTESSVQI